MPVIRFVNVLTRSAMVLSVVIFTTIPSDAKAGFCMEPRPPSIYISKPRKPYCSPNCSDWEVEQYKRDLKRYYSQLEEYANDVTRYVRQAREYVDCMADLD